MGFGPSFLLSDRYNRKAARKQFPGVISTTDALRMSKRQNPTSWGLDESMFPDSAPDPEEMRRRERRKFLASSRRRTGRMSTILTGGLQDDSASDGLG